MGTTELRFEGKVAIVTGAGNGLGRSHALLLASRGAKVVVNDLGGNIAGGGRSSEAADKVVAEIKEAGGEAVASYDSVEDGTKIVQAALDAFGRLDIVVNNAGILRDVTFHKMTDEDWDRIYRVHVLGSFRVTHAAWPHLRDQQYGRIVFTASAAGIYGNFGQANYSAAKLAMLGLSNTLALEGRKRNVFVNTIAPIAGSRLTETVLPKELIDALKPEYVSPLVAWLCHEECQESGALFEVGGGFFAKLRWERSRGKTFRVGRTMSVEDVKRSWGDIAGFEKAEHPADIAQSMQPVMANIQRGATKGGNEWIDVDEALGWEFPEATSTYDERDLSIYALGIGAARDPMDDKELPLVYEMHGSGFKAFPTFGVAPALKVIFDMAKNGVQPPGMRYGLDRVLHGEQYLELARPLPPKAKLKHRARIKEIFDKGKGALVITEVKSYDESGELLITNELTTFVRGAGGWGGDRGPSGESNVPPDRAPDKTVSEKIPENQALLYRLSGDWNPLHADPGFAKAFGFDRPILHGLCTFGYAARHIVSAFAGGDPRKFRSIKVRFAESVFPGETLVTEMWKESETRIVFRAKVVERDKVVISNAALELYDVIPEAKAKPAPKAEKKSDTAAGPVSEDIFTAIGKHLGASPALVEKVQKVFQFKLKSPDAVWTVDVKNGKGGVARGEGTKPDVTLELTDDNFMKMCTGQADPQKLYFGGDLKISGDVMASQKLSFLTRMDPGLVLEAMKARGSGGEAASAPAPAAPSGPLSADVFLGIRAWVGAHPELVDKVKTRFLFKLRDPDSAWTVDLVTPPGAVAPGEAGQPDVTLELSEANFIAMTSGKADPQKLYFSGDLKISGNVMASQKLSFLTKIDPVWAKEQVAKMKAGGASAAPAAAAPAPTAAPKESKAPALFAALAKRLAERPGLADEVRAVIAFKLPAGGWVVDLSRSPGTVTEGSGKDAALTLTLDDDTLVALAKDVESAPSLHQKGKLRVDGDIHLARKLSFLSKLA